MVWINEDFVLWRDYFSLSLLDIKDFYNASLFEQIRIWKEPEKNSARKMFLNSNIIFLINNLYLGRNVHYVT